MAIESSKPKSSSRIRRSSNWGGARPGAGHPPGKKTQRVVDREATLRMLRDRISLNADRILNAQMTLAEGITLLFRVDKDSKGNDKPAIQVTNPDEIKDYIDGIIDSDSYYFITTKAPDNKAIDSMFNRAFGRAPESIPDDEGSEETTYTVTSKTPRRTNESSPGTTSDRA